VSARTRSARPLVAGAAISALAGGIAIASLLTTVARGFNPPMAARWFVFPLLLGPVVLAPALARPAPHAPACEAGT